MRKKSWKKLIFEAVRTYVNKLRGCIVQIMDKIRCADNNKVHLFKQIMW